LFCFLVPFKKQALLKWKLTSPEQDTKQAVNGISLSTIVLSDGESCKDNLPSEPMDVSIEDKQGGPTADIPDRNDSILKEEEEIDKELKYVEDTSNNPTVDDNLKEPISEPAVTDGADSGTIDLEKPVTEKMFTNQDDVQVAAISSPKSPEPLVVSCDSNISHDIDTHDVSDISSEKVTDQQQQQPGDAKTGSGTDTPSQQGKRKKVNLSHLNIVLMF